MRAALYYRTSTQGQEEKHTIASQKAELPKYAERMGWEIVGEYEDEGKSGSFTQGREDFLRLLDDANKKKFDVLLVIEFSRISRSADPIERAMIVKTLKDNNIKVASPADGIQSVESLDDELMVYLKQWQAAKESAATRERTIRGKRNKVLNGEYCLPGIAYGLKKIVTREGQKISHEVVENPEEAAVLRRIYSWVVGQQKSLNWSAKELNRRAEKGLGPYTRKGNRWTVSNLSGILRRGKNSHTGTILTNRQKYVAENGRRVRVPNDPEKFIPVKVPAIFSKEEYKLLSEQISSNRGKPNGQEKPKEVFLLKGKVRCGQCGYKMTSRTGGAPTRKKSSYYVCPNRLNKSCDTPYVRADTLDGKVFSNLISRILIDPKKTLKIYNSAGHKKTEIANCKRRISALDKDIQKLKDGKVRLLDLFVSEIWDQETIERKKADLEAAIEGCEAEKVKVSEELQKFEEMQNTTETLREAEKEIKTFGKRLIKEMWKMDFEQKRNLVRNILGNNNVEIWKTYDGKEPVKLPFITKKNKLRGPIDLGWGLKGTIDLNRVISLLHYYEQTGEIPSDYTRINASLKC